MPGIELYEDAEVLVDDDSAVYWAYYPFPGGYRAHLTVTTERIMLGYEYKSFLLGLNRGHRRWEIAMHRIRSVDLLKRSWMSYFGFYAGTPVMRLTLDDRSTIEIGAYMWDEIYHNVLAYLDPEF